MAKKKKKATVKSKGKVKAKSKAKAKTKKAAKKVVKKATKKAVKKVAKKAVKKAPKKAKKTTPKKSPAVKKTPTPKVTETPKAPEAPLPTIGSDVPPVVVENDAGEKVNLQDYAQKAKHFVLYFYPKDDTPGCTKEACDFRDNLSTLTEHGAIVAGISPDGSDSHKNFVNKYDINFTLLSDQDHKLSEKMGVWKLKNFMGNSYMGVERSTFLFTEGKLSKVWSPVKVEGHVSEILETIKE